MLVVALATAGSRSPERHVPSTLLLRVIDSVTRLPLPNAEITSQDRRGLTDAAGEMRIVWPEDGRLRVRVRQLGFRFVNRNFTRDPASLAEEDTAFVALARTGWVLPQVVVRAERRCKDRGDPRRVALSEASMELLRFGAEQFDNFRRAYPFDISMERRTMPNAPSGRTPANVRAETDTTPSQRWGDRYEPGNVVQRQSAYHYFVPLLFVSALAESTFWNRHCFQARGVESRDGRRVIRLDFAPTLDVRDPDWEGSAWLDSARSVLVRVDFRLANLRIGDGPQRFEGYTVFSTPTPYIAMPDSTVAWWTTLGPWQTYGRSQLEGMQMLVIRELKYRGRTPPAVR